MGGKPLRRVGGKDVEARRPGARSPAKSRAIGRRGHVRGVRRERGELEEERLMSLWPRR